MSAGVQPRLVDVCLRGERVRVRPIDPGDAARAFPLLHGRDEVVRWLVWKGPADLAELEEAYAEWALGGDGGMNYRFAIEAPQDDLVGTISLRFEGHPFVGDVGYWIASERWNRGYATEANRLVAHLGLEHLGARALTAEVFTGNRASARVLEKVGYRREAALDGAPLAGEATDADRPCWNYGLTRRDFRHARGDWAPVEGRVELA